MCENSSGASGRGGVHVHVSSSGRDVDQGARALGLWVDVSGWKWLRSAKWLECLGPKGLFAGPPGRGGGGGAGGFLVSSHPHLAQRNRYSQTGRASRGRSTKRHRGFGQWRQEKRPRSCAQPLHSNRHPPQGHMASSENETNESRSTSR